MRLAVLSDIHGNREALEAVLDDLDAERVDRIAILGDIVGYGPDPEWCTMAVMHLVHGGALCVKGNHDSAIAGRDGAMNQNAKTVIDWTRPRLSEAQREFLDGLPLSRELGDLLLVHASANDPGDWIYVTSEARARPSFKVSRARLILCGHVHVPSLMSYDIGGTVREQRVRIGTPVPLIQSRRWLAVVGSVGQPRDGVPEAGWALVDTGRNELTFRRVPYDNVTTARKMREQGLPDSLASRLMRGA
ncbi:metallophosphoesterase [Cereibacter sphaeroides]|uniref:metallophosphoesterase family protein n=1 Tax=Cereibacter sphaeroides TaxID=1063 RepID=UPI001F2B7B6A|nr:metallophosphoesterase family protein [Cereibacter sphaeroides]MCE6951274.1 metallophosphoesterase [Cereibacter sphaeroides]